MDTPDQKPPEVKREVKPEVIVNYLEIRDAVRRAHNLLADFIEFGGMGDIDMNSPLYQQIQELLEDAVHIGIQTALKQNHLLEDEVHLLEKKYLFMKIDEYS